MGWLFCRPSKETLISHLLDPALYNTGKIIDHSVRGNHLWVLHEGNIDRKRIVLLFLMGANGGQWGYKDMEETVHPYYYDCPLRLINAATEPMNEWSRDWREKVRAYHAKKAAKPKAVAGMTVTYGGIEYRLNHSLGRRGWDVTRTRDGMQFRMKATQVSKALQTYNANPVQVAA